MRRWLQRKVGSESRDTPTRINPCVFGGELVTGVACGGDP